jgi:hypothetical protein
MGVWRVSRIPRSNEGIRCGVHNVLWAGIWCSRTPISPLFAVALWLGTTSFDPLGDLTHGSLCDPV